MTLQAPAIRYVLSYPIICHFYKQDDSVILGDVRYLYLLQLGPLIVCRAF